MGKLQERVKSLELDLRGKVVLTEAATGPYVVTPVLAALAGAKVYAYSKTTHYGHIDEVFEQTRKVYADYHEKPLDITFIDSITPEIIAQADIITNSGHLRPLNEEKLQYAKDGVAIPLMYEAWEWRNADLDLDYVRSRNLRIGATNERHPEVDVFNYLGDMAVKQILDAGLCLYNNRFILICNNDFGPHIAKVVGKICSRLGVIDKEENKDKYNLENVDWLCNFPEIRIPESYRKAEAVIFTAYPFDQVWISDAEAVINAKQFREQLDHPFILRYAGDVDSNALNAEGVRFYPHHVPHGHMGILPSSIGFDPVIRLQAGGLKAGEALLTGNHQHKNIPILELV